MTRDRVVIHSRCYEGNEKGDNYWNDMKSDVIELTCVHVCFCVQLIELCIRISML